MSRSPVSSLEDSNKISVSAGAKPHCLEGVLATQQNFGRASEVLNIAQPALSRQVRLLEDELGVQLFERHSRGSTPTPEGVLLLERASALLRTAEQLKFDIAGLRRAPQGLVVLGLSPALA